MANQVSQQAVELTPGDDHGLIDYLKNLVLRYTTTL